MGVLLSGFILLIVGFALAFGADGGKLTMLFGFVLVSWGLTFMTAGRVETLISELKESGVIRKDH